MENKITTDEAFNRVINNPVLGALAEFEFREFSKHNKEKVKTRKNRNYYFKLICLNICLKRGVKWIIGIQWIGYYGLL